MPNITITNIDRGCVELKDCIHEDALVTFAATDVFAPGTILARDSSTLKYVLFVKGGNTNGNGIPKAVLSYEISRTGSGDVKARVIVKGHIHRERLIIDADGDASNVDGAVLDQLRDYGIVASTVEQLDQLDTQD